METIENKQLTLPESQTLTQAFGRENIEELRRSEKEAFYAAHRTAIEAGKDLDEAESFARTESIKLGHEYLMTFSDTEWAQSHTDDLWKMVDKYSFADMSDAEWLAAERTDDGTVVTPSGIDQLHADLDRLSGSERPPVPEADPQQEALRHELNDLRGTFASLSAKRQGRLLGGNNEAYQEAHTAYNEKVVALGRMKLEAELADGSLSDDEKNALVISYLFAEQATLREQTKDKLANSKVGKFVNWMTSGTKAQRFWKGVGLGAGAALVGGVAGGVVAGVATTAALAGVVAAGTTAAMRFAKGYAKADAKAGRGLGELTDAHAVQAKKDIQFSSESDRFVAATKSFNLALERDTKTERGKRWKSVSKGLAAVAIGGAVGTAVFIAADALPDFAPGDWLHRQDPLTQGTDVFADSEVPEGPEIADEPPTETEPPVEPAPETPSLDPNFVIESGEGGIHFFQSLGLSEADWYSVAGELRDNFPNEFYTEGYDVRLSQPGQLSIEAQQFIKTRFGLA
jgi:hypothetical protein